MTGAEGLVTDTYKIVICGGKSAYILRVIDQPFPEVHDMTIEDSYRKAFPGLPFRDEVNDLLDC